MAKKEENAYILGTEQEELHRLGLQHQVWASEARKGWELAEIGHGQRVLDLGCGPGFCTRDLAYMVGMEGEVVGVDMSPGYIDMVNKTAKLHQLSMKGVCTDFNKMILGEESFDAAYCRWALAWIPNPEEIIAKVRKALVPGGAFVVHEYYDWSMLQTEPSLPNLDKCIAAALKSFKDSPGEIDVGRKLPAMFLDEGLEVISVRPMTKMATPESLVWQWPNSFFHIYFPKVVEMGLLDKETCEQGLEEMNELGDLSEATILCPQMVEVIGVKM